MSAAPSPFFDGYTHALHNRPSVADEYPEGRPREKYVAGYEIGAKDRADGALEPMEPLS